MWIARIVESVSLLILDRAEWFNSIPGHMFSMSYRKIVKPRLPYEALVIVGGDHLGA
jgi:hypothetical protein